MNGIVRPTSVCLAVVLFGSLAATAQDVSPLVVTGVSGPAAASVASPEAETAPIILGTLASDARIQVAANQAVMLQSTSGRAAILLVGPASLHATAIGSSIDLEVESGWVVVRAKKLETAQPVRIIMSGATPEDDLRLAAPVGDGVTYVTRQGDTLELGFEGAADGLPLFAFGEERTLASGQRVSVTASEASAPTGLDPWRQQANIDPQAITRGLALAAAKERRKPVAAKLLENVLDWDVYGQGGAVSASLAPERAKPEIRALSAVVATQNPTNSNLASGGARLADNFATANQVPSLSPAAISVGGVAAVNLLNNRASLLLQSTQARGLGFGGLSLLAIPGIDPITGSPTIGPPGLGARR